MLPRKSTVKGCNSSKKNLYRIPKDCSEEWREVINYGDLKNLQLYVSSTLKAQTLVAQANITCFHPRYHKDVVQIFPLLLHYPQVRILRCLKTMCLLYLLSLLS